MVFKRTTFYYEKPGKEHTEKTLKIVLEAAKERNIGTILVASTTGETALKALEIFYESGINLVIIAHQYGEINDKIVFNSITKELEKDVKLFISKVKK